MSLEVVKSFIYQVSLLDIKNVSFIWHGGEPLLAGLSFYEKVYDLQSLYLSKKRFSNSFQSNGTLINQDWALFSKSRHFSFGISIDGPEDIHDLNRVFVGGRGTFERVMNGIRILRENKIEPGIVSVITKDSIHRARDIFNFFVQNNLRKINFSPCAEKWGEELDGFSLSPREWASFMIEIFDEWIKKDDPSVKIQLLESLFQGLIGGKPTLCSCTKDCSQYIAVDSNGDLYLCGRFLGISEFRLGNLMQQSIKELFRSGVYSTFVEKTSAVREECEKCPWESTCNGGCTYYRYMNGSIDNPYYFCSSTKRLLSHMKEKISMLEEAD